MRQGATASPPFFNVYMDELYDKVETSGLGCVIDDFAYSIVSYADDLTLISPSCVGLQMMIDIVSSYCDKVGLKLSTDPDPKKSKSKCVYFNCKQTPKTMSICGMSMPWVNNVVHLGHIIHSDESTNHDLTDKRASYISTVHSLRQELGDQDPAVFLRLIGVYGSSFYGSSLWDLSDDKSNKLYAAWNRTIRYTYNIPINTHRYILQMLFRKADLQSILMKRFHKFHARLLECGKPEVLHLVKCQSRDLRSTHGRNCRLYRQSSGEVSEAYRTPIGSEWREGPLMELLATRHHDVIIPGFVTAQCEAVLSDICIN